MRIVELSREEFAALLECIPLHARNWKDVDGHRVLVMGLVGFMAAAGKEETGASGQMTGQELIDKIKELGAENLRVDVRDRSGEMDWAESAVLIKYPYETRQHLEIRT